MHCLSEWPLDEYCYNYQMLGQTFRFLLCVLFFSLTIFAQTSAPLPRVADINGMAVSLVKPAFPVEAAIYQADGSAVSVLVTVDETGNVISAKCSLTCHEALKDAAELAAATSTFKPLVVGGKAVKYEGILLFTFVVDRVDWYRFGTAFESVRQFDNISVGPMAQIFSAPFADEKTKLLELDAKGVELETRWKVMREVENSLKGKLQDGDLWRFEIGMALRLVTFWTMAGEKTNRVDLQKAIDSLEKFIASAPPGVSSESISALKAVARYRVSADLPERELRQAINAMTRNIRFE